MPIALNFLRCVFTHTGFYPTLHGVFQERLFTSSEEKQNEALRTNAKSQMLVLLVCKTKLNAQIYWHKANYSISELSLGALELCICIWTTEELGLFTAETADLRWFRRWP